MISQRNRASKIAASGRNYLQKVKKKKFRIDYLIEEHVKYLKHLENEIKSVKNLNTTNKSLELKNSFILPEKSTTSTSSPLSYDNYDFFNYNINRNYANSKFNKNEQLNDISLNVTNDFNIQSNSYQDLVQEYQSNLIRYEVVQKLHVELNIARMKLDKCMRTQLNLESVRKRVAWLENEIETILISSNKVKFPLQGDLQKDLSYLKVEKVPRTFRPPKIEELEQLNVGTLCEPNKSDAASEAKEKNSKDSEANQVIDLFSKWDKQSTGSTNSLIESDDEDIHVQLQKKLDEKNVAKIEDTNEENKQIVEQVNEENESEKLDQEENKFELGNVSSHCYLNAETSNKNETIESNDFFKNDLTEITNISGNDEIYLNNANDLGGEDEIDFIESLSRFPKASTFIDLNNSARIDSNKQLKINNSDLKSAKTILTQSSKQNINDKKSMDEIPFYNQPHNRFLFADYSRKIATVDPTSYHKLGLAITDSYIENENEIDGKIPQLEFKERLERDDIKFLKLASYIENVSKRLCKSSRLFMFNRGGEKENSLYKSNTSLNNQVKPSNSRLNSATALNQTKQFLDVNTSSVKCNESTANIKSLLSVPTTYEAPSLLPVLYLPNTKLNSKISYPRIPTVYLSTPSIATIDNPKANSIDSYVSAPHRLVNQHNLKDQTQLKLYTSPRKNSLGNNFNFNLDDETSKEIKTPSREPELIKWSEIKPDSSPLFHSGLRFEKVKSLLRINLKSKCHDEKLDAIKHLGLLKLGDSASIYALSNILINENENELVKFESAKSLVLLGYWNESIFEIFDKYLKNGNQNVKKEIFNAIINSKNPQYTNVLEPASRKFINTLEEYTTNDNESISLEACISLGKLGIKSSELAYKKLFKIIQTDVDWNRKTLAVEALVKLFDAKDSITINYILHQIQFSPNWISRTSGIKLLSYLGIPVLCRSEYIDSVYKLLESRLYEDPINECRLQIGRTIKDLKFFDKVFNKANKNLQSLEEEIRIKAVLSIDMLEVKQAKTIETLIDMLELDESERVRIRVLKALFNLAPNNQKVLKVFNSLEKNSKIFQIYTRMKEQQQSSFHRVKKPLIQINRLTVN